MCNVICKDMQNMRNTIGVINPCLGSISSLMLIVQKTMNLRKYPQSNLCVSIT